MVQRLSRELLALLQPTETSPLRHNLFCGRHVPLSSPVLRIGALPPRCRCDAVVVERVRPWSCSGSPPPPTSGGVRCCGSGSCLIPPDLSRRRRVVLQQPHASGMTSHAAGCRLCAAPAGGQRCPYSSTPLAVDGGSAISRAGPKRVPLAAGQGRVTRRQCDRAADFSRSPPGSGPWSHQVDAAGWCRSSCVTVKTGVVP